MARSNEKEPGKPAIRDEEFRILAEDAPVMLWLTNPEGKIIFTNSRWKKFIGAAVGEQVSGDAWYQALHPDDREHCLRTFEQAFHAHQSFAMEYRLRRLDGEYRYVLDTGEPYINREGKFSGFIGSSSDITDRKNSENQLRRSEQELTRHNREMQLINELNSYLQVCESLQETHGIVTNYASKIFSDCAGALYLFNDARNAVEAVSTWGNIEHLSASVISPQECWGLRQSRVHIVEHLENAITCRHLTHCPDFGYVCAPAIAQGEMIGFLYVEFGAEMIAQGRSISSRTRVVSIAADNLAMALVSLKLREALRSQSVRDPLTRLYNRRYMEETTERELSRCKRSNESVGVIIMDVDHFKRYNDTCGHDAGDLVLREIANIAGAKLRKGDIACRYGGEEFVLILPGARKPLVAERAEEIRKSIAGHAIEYRGDPLPTATISAGVSAFPEDGATVAELIKSADVALYKSKEGGRNRVTVADGVKSN
jgi:diguanylate cyclase (GGDEF)-like protein/PAS domain S-box-containing protein